METIEKKKAKILANEMFLYLNDDTVFMFCKVIEFPGSPGCYIGHINIMYDNAPFYFLFKKHDIRCLNMRGYKNCSTIANSFTRGYDKNGKMYLRSDTISPDTYLKHYKIKTMEDLRKIAELRMNGHRIHAGFAKSNKLVKLGEAFEIIINN